MRSRQGSLFGASEDFAASLAVAAGPHGCRISAIGKRRDGGTKYWCFEHRADATAKYGTPAEQCRYAHVPRPTADETLVLYESQFPGGIALWGSVPPVYDTTTQPLDRGVHVHARQSYRSKKIIDNTYREVIFHPTATGLRPITISELDAIYFMVSSVLGFPMRYVECTLCGYPHLDRDWFSVHAHGKHLCAGCGKTFRDSVSSVGNPLAAVVKTCPERVPAVPATKTISIRQQDYPGGLQIWGSNPAIIWTSNIPEEAGIHIHAYGHGSDPDIDDTFARVILDGVEIDAHQIRTLMAQSALPHILGRIVTVHCSSCGSATFDQGERAFTPSTEKICPGCGTPASPHGRLRKVVSNPMVATLERLAISAPRSRAYRDLGLIPETI